MSQTHVKLLVLDLAQVDLVDAAGLGILLDLQEWTRANAIRLKLTNVMNKVEHVLELPRLDRVLEFCSVQDVLCLLRGARLISSGRLKDRIRPIEANAGDTARSPASQREGLPAGFDGLTSSYTIQTNQNGVSIPSLLLSTNI